ncbi:glycosyltransferase family 2 protein [Mucilaginibacter pallidiroseus]|uniref:Glycosyltransferase family 2 protein n=1 Tax=Mucilaginibacter pallidiroseus TaxID=2599295 RepID=A0A563UJ90_9SPHI|nr:glycosyltransferase family 2 protein [Mucilaginibacter pallidiroseus]TWR31373.1 glycosyltransferase family 2 protein [Mucilaginibacter pallidiroseus]
MKLSVIIVNYNMCASLKQALSTLVRACKFIDSEIVVIDDASTDRSLQMLESDFPEVEVIRNDKNIGIAASRNVGIEKATGEYVLMVSPDIITGKKTLESIIEFMDSHPEAGAAGVRMLTPRGDFLKQSRTGFVRPWGTLLKLTGLAKYFTKSRLYKYELDAWDDEDDFATTEVDVVNGSFMMLRKSALQETGLLDERFTSYGHDIDISFRMRLAGYKNYYYPRTYILNFSNSLNPKISWKHIRDFYGAMIIFATKYLFKVPEIKIPGIPQVFAPTYEVER